MLFGGREGTAFLLSLDFRMDIHLTHIQSITEYIHTLYLSYLFLIVKRGGKKKGFETIFSCFKELRGVKA